MSNINNENPKSPSPREWLACEKTRMRLDQSVLPTIRGFVDYGGIPYKFTGKDDLPPCHLYLPPVKSSQTFADTYRFPILHLFLERDLAIYSSKMKNEPGGKKKGMAFRKPNPDLDNNKRES